jgi:hypothetical protein
MYDIIDLDPMRSKEATRIRGVDVVWLKTNIRSFRLDTSAIIG